MRWPLSIRRTLLPLVWAQLAKRSPSENAFLILIPVVGAGTGIASVLIAHLIAFLQKLAWGSGEQLLTASAATPWPRRIITLAIGGAFVGFVGWLTRSALRGQGTSSLIQALALKGGDVSVRKTWPRVAMGILTVASGGSLGREGPMIQFAAMYGSHLGRRCGLTTQQVRILVCCAASSAISAVYNAPIGGTLFAMEILIGNFALEIFGPVVVASVVSTLIFRSAMGDLPRFVIPEAYRATYKLVSNWELVGYLGLGIVGGIVAVIMIKAVFWSEDLFAKLPLPRYTKPALGFALVGVIGCFLPHVFSNGYEATNLALREDPTLTLGLLLVLPLAKLAATALTSGSGGAGGLFTPSLMIGALTGGAFGFGMHAWFPHHTAEYGAYALVGMGAVLAGTTHAPITAILMIFEQTNSYQIILPLMFVCIVSNFTARLLKRQSLHEEALRRSGVVLPRGPEAGVMQTLRVADLMHEDVDAVPANAPFAAVVDRFLKTRVNYLHVVNADGRFLGAIPLHGLKELLNQSDNLGAVVAIDLLDEKFEFVTPEQKLADTMDKFWRQDSERLPVLADARGRKLIGWISKRDLIGVYSQEILQKRQLTGKFTVSDEAGERNVFIELPEGLQIATFAVPVPLAGHTLAELAPRSEYGVHVLQIQHRDPATGQEVIELAGAATRLAAEDRLVVIGRADGIARLRAALQKPGVDPIVPREKP